MTAPILSTKLFIPPTRADLLPRSQLIEKLNESAAYPLALISASAGSGKTTILSEWVAKKDRPTAWISLDAGDNDAALFLTYFIAALRTIREDFGEEAAGMLQVARSVPLETIAISLINQAAEFPENFTLVLDDYHVITDPQTNELMAFLIDHLPPRMQLVIASRIDPPWPLARYRARNQLFEIRGQDLRFSAEEASEFLNRTMGLDLRVEEVEALEERTEGWVAGLRLAAIALQAPLAGQSPGPRQGRKDIPEFVKAFSGSHVFVAEYLVEEILKQQPEEIQSFLLRTSVLERLNAGLCEAVSGCVDGQAILRALHRANLFVIPQDQEGEWFRYHHLFADLLQARLPQALPAEAIQALHERASVWYERHGYIREAVKHALAGKDFERAAGLVARAARGLIFSGRVNSVRAWLEALPEASFQARPELRFYLFWIDLLQNRADLSEGAIQEVEDLLKRLPSTPENDRLRGELMAVVCRAMALSGRTSRGIRLAQEAMAYLPTEDRASRARAYSALAIAHDLEGRGEEAEPAYRECLSQAMAAGDYRLAAHTRMAKGLIQSHYGQLHEAARTFQTIIDMGDEADMAPTGRTFFPAGQGHIGLGSIHLEWNDRERAEEHLKQGMELCRRGGLDGIFIARMQMARLRQARGDLAGAVAETEASKQAFQRVDDFNIATRQIQICLAKEDVEGAWRWAAPLSQMLSGDSAGARLPLVFFEVLQAIIARAHLARRETGKALELLDRLQATAEPGRRVGRLIEVHLLRALAQRKQHADKPTAAAIENMEQALALGGPEGYVTLFLEEGPAVIPLLQAVANHQAAGGIKKYALMLLEAFSEKDGAAAVKRQEALDLVEQLTPRETEVLALIAAGDSNQAIAEKLFITVRTVKKHTSNIYGKLNVSSRTQAVAYAREIGLLPKL